MKNLLYILILLILGGNINGQQSNIKRLQTIYDSIKSAGIRHPDVVMAQCIQETRWLDCNRCCLRYNNIFGFYNRENKCMQFTSISDCIEFYKKWQDKRYLKWRNKYPHHDYFHFLKEVRFATGDKYTEEVKPILKWVKRNLSL